MASLGVFINDITTIIKKAMIVFEYAKLKAAVLSKMFIFFFAVSILKISANISLICRTFYLIH